MKYLWRDMAQGHGSGTHPVLGRAGSLFPLEHRAPRWARSTPLHVLGVPNPSQSRDTLLVSAIQALFPHPTQATLPNPGTGRSIGFSGCSRGGSCVLPHLWSGLGLPFFLMLLAVVSLKCSRPTVTLVTCSGGRFTLEGKENKGMSEDGSYLGMVPIFSHFSPISSFLRWEVYSFPAPRGLEPNNTLPSFPTGHWSNPAACHTYFMP